MSLDLVRKALENRLKAMSPDLSTAYENLVFTPVTGTAYQKVDLLPGTPNNEIQSAATYFERGIFQVTLMYPPNTGPGAATARATYVKNHFKRGLWLYAGVIAVFLPDTPRVAAPLPINDRYAIPISISYQAQVIVP